jgi:hypothetical protein
MERTDAEALGWQVCADEPGYWRAEKLTPNGSLVSQAGASEYEMLAAVEAWEDYPVPRPGVVQVEQPTDPAGDPPAADATSTVSNDGPPAPVVTPDVAA